MATRRVFESFGSGLGVDIPDVEAPEVDPDCIFVDVDDISDALEAIGQVEGHHSIYDAEVAAALIAFVDEQVPWYEIFPFSYTIEPTEDGHYLTVCPREPIETLFRAYAAVRAGQAARTIPTVQPPSTPVPELAPAPEPTPSPPPVQRAGFAPETSPWAWLLLAGAVGATWWYVRRYGRR